MNFIIFERSLILRQRYELSQIGAMDETPVWLDMPADTIVEFVGMKSIPIKTTGHEKSRFTVCLAAKANGIKLPPFLVFKGKRRDRELDGLGGIVCVMSQNGWMNEKLTHEWLQTVWGAGFHPSVCDASRRVILKGNFSRRAKIERCSHRRNTN